ncbi:MAG: MobF family relaxase [Pseudomonadota bacterium]
MLSIGMVSSAGAASKYFDKDNYYGEGETSPSRWMGQGAEALGLRGGVDARAFQAVLEGEVPGASQRLGFADRESGDWKHQPGWDLTFSAPKSVTLLAMLGGDRRIVGAHDRAVANTVAMIERDYSTTRLRQGGEVVQEKTGSLTVAAFRHDLSRLQEPQLHSHAIVVNMTEGQDGKWRSLVSRDIYRDTLSIGLAYRQELALELRNLGYEIDLGKQGMFEVRGVSQDLVDAFSTRRTEVISWLEAHGIDPAKATAAQSQRAALATRNNKISGADRDALALEWRATATDAGLANLTRTVNAALTRGSADITHADRDAAADDLLQRAIESVAERSAAWTPEDVLKEAGRLAPGKATSGDLKTGLARLQDKGTVVAREVTRPDPVSGLDRVVEGLTRQADKVLEQLVIKSMLVMPDTPRIMRSAKGLIARSVSAAERQGHAWNDGQRAATRLLIESRHAVTGLQGLAGTAKTTTVLKTVAEAAAKRGHHVIGLAPTASAADELGRAISSPGQTLAAHLLARPEEGRGKQLWIVDEASMVSSRDMERLLARARGETARLILVGDVHQLGAVEAGAPFRQMQEAGMPTAILERIVRQRDAGLRTAVEDAARGRIAEALGGFAEKGGQLVTLADETRRFEKMARDYAALTPEERRRTIVIEPSVKGRARLNAEIRTALIEQGELGPKELPTDTLRRVGLTRAEAREIVSYVPGTLVRFRRGYRMEDGAVRKGEYLRVTGTADGDKVLLERVEGGGGEQISWRPALKGSSQVEAFERVETDLRKGDRIRWHENTTLGDRTIRNGQQANVARVTAKGEAVVNFEGQGKGKGGQVGMVKLDLNRLDHRHWSHAYAETAHAAQGRTSDRVMLHAESGRLNLINHKSIYVALSRARDMGTVYTDDAGKLVRGAAGRKGESATASDRDEITRARLEAERIRQQQRPEAETSVTAILERLDKQIRAIIGRGLELDGAKAKVEPKAPEIRRGPSMRR